MTKAQKRALAAEAARILKDRYPDAACSLEYARDPFRLLVMGRLSAQCTDARVNLVCRELFRVLPDAEAMANAPIEQIEALIKPCGLYRTKAQNLKDAARMILTEFDGKVPMGMDELLRLPGVGRKIANLLRGDLYGIPGIVADTHCIRVCGRLGFYPEACKDPVKAEKILSELVPIGEQTDFCHRLVDFGRDVCTARAPRCTDCPMTVCKHHPATLPDSLTDR